jgi:hypothetical protein
MHKSIQTSYTIAVLVRWIIHCGTRRYLCMMTHRSGWRRLHMYISQSYIPLSLLVPQAKVVLLGRVWRSGGTIPGILNFRTECCDRSAASSLDEGHRHSVDKKMDGLQNPSRCCVREKSMLSLGIEPGCLVILSLHWLSYSIPTPVLAQLLWWYRYRILEEQCWGSSPCGPDAARP